MENNYDEIGGELWSDFLQLATKYQDRISPSGFVYLNMCFLTEIAFKTAPDQVQAIASLLDVLGKAIECQRKQ